MDNLFAAGSASLLSLPLPLSGSSSEAPKPLLKSTSLSRLDELQQYLKQCDNQQYIRRYYKVRRKARAWFLNGSETRWGERGGEEWMCCRKVKGGS